MTTDSITFTKMAVSTTAVPMPAAFACELCGHLDDPRQCSYAARRAQGRAALCSSCLPGKLSDAWSAGVVWDGVVEILNPTTAVVAT
jgi:hypothetical protein